MSWTCSYKGEMYLLLFGREQKLNAEENSKCRKMYLDNMKQMVLKWFRVTFKIGFKIRQEQWKCHMCTLKRNIDRQNISLTVKELSGEICQQLFILQQMLKIGIMRRLLVSIVLSPFLFPFLFLWLRKKVNVYISISIYYITINYYKTHAGIQDDTYKLWHK